ncbi:hypothetical protein DRE_03391 [Drechslerella stenobrocha 248]|uniref:Uncharacterized protein n=1 Tax=Drechslerella stenobrocha 248 TaxID=1043628 RepID=W7I499_9PEZI|nr:hypothetical protein DRE_03391 [Drechslerella stenobrocha 248]
MHLHPVIIIHSLSGLSELTQFYLPISSTASAVPAAAVFLCLIQCATNLILVRTLTRGIPALVRPVYQAGALLRTVFVLAAYAGASHELWHDSIVIIHAFAYTRLICFLFTTASAFTDTEVSEGAGAGAEIKGMSKLSVAQTYTVAVYGAALVSMGQMQHVFVGRYAAVAFLVIVAVVMRLEGWVERQMVLVAGCEMKRGCLGDHVAYLLYRIGICKLEVLLQMDRRVTA